MGEIDGFDLTPTLFGAYKEQAQQLFRRPVPQIQ